MGFLFKPGKMFGLVGGTVGCVLVAALVLFSLIVFITIQQLPFGKFQAWEWYVGGPVPVGVVRMGDASGLGLDPAALAEWFGGSVTAEYHDLRYLSQFGRVHNGVDFSLGAGTPVRSTWEGTVAYAGWSDAGYGNLVVVQNGGWKMCYGHLSSISVKPGQKVDTGTTLGGSGSSGWSTGPHLHYEVQHQGEPVDPMTAPTAEGKEEEGSE